MAKPVPHGSIQPGSGSRMLVGVRVIHLEARLSSAGHWRRRFCAAVPDGVQVLSGSGLGFGWGLVE